MHLGAVTLAFSVLCAPFACGQTSTEPVDRVFHFAHIEDTQELREVTTLVALIVDLKPASLDEAHRTLSVRGTSDQIALAAWLLNELDRPAGPAPETQKSTVLEYRMAAAEENTVRVFYLPYATSVQELQEVATLVRAISDIKWLFTYNAPRAIAARGTADQIAVAAWILSELGKPAPQNTAPPEYRMPGSDGDTVAVFRAPNTQTLQDFQEVATLVRSIADIRRLFTFNKPRVMALRGTPDQIALAWWLVNKLDAPASSRSGANEYRMSGGSENVVRVFYLPETIALPDFQEIAVNVRTATGVRREFLYNAPRAMALRGTVTQIAQAERMINERAWRAVTVP